MPNDDTGVFHRILINTYSCFSDAVVLRVLIDLACLLEYKPLHLDDFLPNRQLTWDLLRNRV